MIRVYTIHDLRDWLVEGKENGLSEAVIAKPRAWAFVNNPCADLNTPAVAVLFDNDEMKGYAAAFPEHFLGLDQKVYWGSTYFVDGSMRGQGCGVKILSALQDSLDGIYATTQTPVTSSAIFKKLGAEETWFPEYWVKLQKLNPCKGKHTLAKRWLNRSYAQLFQKRGKWDSWCDSFGYQLEYCSFIDDETYSFIQRHKGSDLLLRSKDMLNWMLTYPFLQNVVMPDKTKGSQNFFSCYKPDFEQYAVRVLDEVGSLVGFYCFKVSEGEVNLLYLYYASDSKDLVMASFYGHLLKLEAVRLRTTCSELISFMKRHALPIHALRKSRLNLCAPKSLYVPDGTTLQGGDGDMFVI